MLHLSELAPFPSSQVRAKLEHAGRVITVENNSTGQLARLLTRETLVTPHEHVLRYDGRPFKGQELAGQLKAALR
jgi:2-oxoglutarate ferredoxin oxidoreductase subunit alpha